MKKGSSIFLMIIFLAGTSLIAANRVDHRKFPQLKGPFHSGEQVTTACLSCHSQVGDDLLSTSHWLWKGQPTKIEGHPGLTQSIGKANLINNFCIGVQSNEESCTRCHIGFGWKDKNFNFKDPHKIDCLVCHDTTGEYVRPVVSHGPKPANPPVTDWVMVAQNVGRTSIQSCGTCHFNGGGGEAVKHGDLDPSLMEADASLDVHLDLKGLGFTCSTCHKGEEIPHHIRGRSASVSTNQGEELSCETCHGSAPHGQPFIYRTQKEKKSADAFHQNKGKARHENNARLNWHARTIACQTCHIPLYATSIPTKTWWDWSTAGRRDEKGQSIQETDENGNITYMGIKGSFKWEQNIVPEYRWTNKTNERYLLGDKLDPTQILVLNRPLGNPTTPGSKIAPFKIMRGKQIFDKVHNTLIQPKLSGPKGSGAYWSDFNWDAAARQGMVTVNLPYSGQYGFIETEMYWPLSHMNKEGARALSCQDCHSSAGRLAKMKGVYIPAQTKFPWVDRLGWISVLITLLGVAVHGILRWRGSKQGAKP